jgi:G3E family GTPase
MADLLPVSLLTGFLGSGKTTLLGSLLAHPSVGETAVIVNELGEVAIDHHLLRRVDERTVLLANGCVCCSMRADLSEELLDLLGRRATGEVPWFRRVVVETTGLADPAPIVQTLVSDPVLKHHVELEVVITTVDAISGLGQLEREDESLRQAAAADRIVLTKTDVVDAAAVQRLADRLHTLNPIAPILQVSFGDVEPRELLGPGARQASPLQVVGGGNGPAHANGVRSFALTFDQPLDWTAFGVWLTMLLQSRGQDVLRVKGLLDVGLPGPLLLNGVQHVVHPPVHLDAWPDGDRRSRIVFIARGIEPARAEASLAAFSRLPC